MLPRTGRFIPFLLLVVVLSTMKTRRPAKTHRSVPGAVPDTLRQRYGVSLW
jgi:hypothetical protein